MTHSIAVVPWPQYSDSGRDITWEVRVECDKFRGTLQWSTKLGRFRKGNHVFRLRRGSPQIYRAAVDFMRDFCSPRCDTKSQFCDTKSAQRDSYKRDASCARGAFGCCHGVTRDVTRCDCDKYCDIHGCLRRDRSATRQGMLPEGIERHCDCFGGVCAAGDPCPLENKGIHDAKHRGCIESRTQGGAA